MKKEDQIKQELLIKKDLEEKLKREKIKEQIKKNMEEEAKVKKEIEIKIRQEFEVKKEKEIEKLLKEEQEKLYQKEILLKGQLEHETEELRKRQAVVEEEYKRKSALEKEKQKALEEKEKALEIQRQEEEEKVRRERSRLQQMENNLQQQLSQQSSKKSIDSTPTEPLQTKLPFCDECHLQIHGKGLQAINKIWHSSCFVCNSCKKPISGSFLHSNGKPYCIEDYQRLFSKTCAGCGQTIQGQLVRAMGKEWHAQNCFVCSKCRGPLGSSFFEKGGKPLCKNCAS